MQKRRERKRGYGSWWLAVGREVKGGFYKRKHFMNCVEGLGVVVCGREVFLHDACVWGWRFPSLWIAKGGDMGFVVGGLGLASGLAGNSLVLEAVGN